MLQILLVDDEPYVVEDLSATIPWQQLGIDLVHLAYSGMEALEILQKHPIDIVITDINMPEMSGIQLIDRIRARWKHVKCVLLTGYAEFEYAKQAIELQASAYLIKPVGDDLLIESISRLQAEIQREWENWSSYNRTMQTFREHLPLLRDKLLNELLQGSRMSAAQLADKMDKYNLPFARGDRTSLLIVRLEEYFQRHDMSSLLLFEYAIVNIAGELLQEHFHLWSCKDSYDYLVFLVAPKPSVAAEEALNLLEQTAYQLQKNVSTIIGGGISVVTTGLGAFPESAQTLYQSAVATIRQRIGPETGVYLSSKEVANPADIPAIQSLYEPPTLFQLFQMNNWESIREKVAAIVQELKLRPNLSPEHVQEAKHHLQTAFYYIAHRNGKLLGDIVGVSSIEERSIHIPEQLQDWALNMLELIKSCFETERMDERSHLFAQVHEYVDQNLHYVSLQSIADHVGLHPVYLSKIYKSETGNRISDYIFQAKMEKAAYLLAHSPLKIYEISSQLGYSNAHYFIKLFKEYSGITPQEFRDARKT